jgi:hypothetical protein
MKYITLAVALLIVGCSGSPLLVNRDNYNKLHDDMSEQEVQSILGPPTSSTSQPIPIVGGTETTFSYQNDKTSITLVFKNNLLKEKSSSFTE